MWRTRTLLIAMTMMVAGIGAFSTGKDPLPAGAKASVRPNAPVAVAAMNACEQDYKNAEDAYRNARRDATTRPIQKLEAAKRDVMKAGQLDEANAIQSAIDSAKESLTKPGAADANARRENLRTQFTGTKWGWKDSTIKDATIVFNDDGSLTTSWSNKSGVWVSRADGIVIARIWPATNSALRFTAEMTAGRIDNGYEMWRIP